MKQVVCTLSACLWLCMAVGAQQSFVGNKHEATPVRSAAVRPDYVIGPEDILKINVWKEPEMSCVVPVRPDGKISMPLIGEIEAAGMTPLALQQMIGVAAMKFVTNPQITVIVNEIRSKKVFVMGEVVHPGSFPLTAGMTALQALGSAGGLSANANSKHIFILRKVNDSTERLSFNYNALLKGSDKNADVLLKAGDTIVVR